MNILITGATGFIGKHIVTKLMEEEHNVSITLLPGEKNPFFSNRINSFILEANLLEKLPKFLYNKKIEGIIHLASLVQSGNHNIGNLPALIDTNIKFSTLVLESAVNAKVSWFINTGTYWQHYNQSDYSPVNIYAATKQAFMDIAQYYWETNKIRFHTIKLFDTYGPNDPRPKIFTYWNKIAESGEELDMSLGEQVIDISYISDIVDAFLQLANLLTMKANLKNGENYFVSAKERFTLKELANKFEKATNSKLNINWGKRPYRDREMMTIPESIKTVPGWSAKVSIEEGIKKFVSNSCSK